MLYSVTNDVPREAARLFVTEYGHAAPDGTARRVFYLAAFLQGGDFAAVCGRSRIGGIGVLCHVAVHPAHRGCGLGSLLVDEQIRRLKGAQIIVATVRAWNETMRAMLQRRGFQEVFRFKDKILLVKEV